MATRIEITDLMAKGVRDDSPVANKAFEYIDSLLRATGWYMVINKENQLAYAYPGFDMEYYNIEIFSDKVYVSFPLKNIPYQCHLCLTNVEETVMALERHFDNFMPTKLGHLMAQMEQREREEKEEQKEKEEGKK